MNRCFAAFLITVSTFAITGCGGGGGDVIPDDTADGPSMTAAEQAEMEAYSKSQGEAAAKQSAPQ